MSDFIATIGPVKRGKELLQLLQLPYAGDKRPGEYFEFAWGSLAVLRDHLANGRNILAANTWVLGWVGDLTAKISEPLIESFVEELVQCLANGNRVHLVRHQFLDALNGAFALFIASGSRLIIVTDPLSFTQVFVAFNKTGAPLAIGTHSDLVAIAGDVENHLDLISIAEHIRNEYGTFPNTMYESVKELTPGSIHIIGADNCRNINPLQSFRYWFPPPEMDARLDMNDLADDLAHRLNAAVYRACVGQRIGVALSGGLDSRLVLALIPKDRTITAFTMIDTMNREARTARRVASVYRVAWVALTRPPEYLAEVLLPATRLIGFDCSFVHAHALGFCHWFNTNADTLLTGDLLDTLLRGYTARDFTRVKRLFGLLPPSFEKVECDYARFGGNLIDEVLTEKMRSDVINRRGGFFRQYRDPSRKSDFEWAKSFPFRHWVEVATWAAQRRVLLLRLVGSDKRLLDFAFRCPLEYKLHSRIYLQVSKDLYGPGADVPSANDGVRPGSGHWSLLVQRAARKLDDSFVRLQQAFGAEPIVQHSWHDYQKYWRESKRLEDLRQQFGQNLERFDGVLFKGSGLTLLRSRQTNWECGFRLLQLAVWLGIVKGYRESLRENNCGQT